MTWPIAAGDAQLRADFIRIEAKKFLHHEHAGDVLQGVEAGFEDIETATLAPNNPI